MCLPTFSYPPKSYPLHILVLLVLTPFILFLLGALPYLQSLLQHLLRSEEEARLAEQDSERGTSFWPSMGSPVPAFLMPVP